MTEPRPTTRRGVALLAFVVGLLIVGTEALWLGISAGTASVNYLGHYQSTGALYAAESGGELAMLELKQGSDVDGDGTIGTISNDANDADDPTLSNGSFHVSVGGKLYTATSAWGNYKRVVEIKTQ